MMLSNVVRSHVKVEHVFTLSITDSLTAGSAAKCGTQLKDKLKEWGIPSGPVWFTLGRDRIILKELKYPVVNEAIEPDLVRMQVVKELIDGQNDVIIDYFPLPTLASTGEKRALTVVLRKDWLEICKTICEHANLKLMGVTPRFFTVLNAVRQAHYDGGIPGKIDPNAVLAVITRGERWAEITIGKGEIVFFSRSITGAALLNEKSLINEIRRNLTVFAGQNPGLPVEEICVAETSSVSGWTVPLSHAFSQPIRSFDPLHGLPTSLNTDVRGSFAALYGLTVYQGMENQLPVNFVSPREPKIVENPNKKLLYRYLPILVVVLLIAFGYGLSVRFDTERELELLYAKKADIEKGMKGVKSESSKIKALRDWEDRRIIWLDELYDFTYLSPDPTRTQLVTIKGNIRENDSKSRDPQKAKLAKYSGHLEWKVLTNDSLSIDQMMNTMDKDGYYLVQPKKQLAFQQSGEKSPFNQQFDLRVEIQPKLPTKYTRYLSTKPEEKQERKTVEGDNPFGGDGNMFGGNRGGGNRGGGNRGGGKGFGGFPGGKQ